jgi:hypothetical protein
MPHWPATRARTRRGVNFGNFRALQCSPAKAGVQEREALQCLRPELGTLLRSVLGPGIRRGTAMKPLNVWPMLIMLIAVLFIILWLGGAFH